MLVLCQWTFADRGERAIREQAPAVSGARSRPGR